ncbi:hypothetical protein [Alkaliphilus serpentinus]|uniref:Uncharacterized protein n=1 Tax=Alkaliphilus serpentinus TaxID=1482731 RepID=A0A833HMY5_9FIRM|nr:hypothetical protein [Alkaliphilus serpentinus]KAB3529050.1 hypothetical protein F8153_10365 [Alkaliphilus serpentinus]
MNEINYISIEFLNSFTGGVFITNLITHFIKDYFPKSLDKKISTLIVAFIVTLTSNIIMKGISFSLVYLSTINSFLVAAAAMGNYDLLTKRMRKGNGDNYIKN